MTTLKEAGGGCVCGCGGGGCNSSYNGGGICGDISCLTLNGILP